jgi:hypothetical protein
VTRPAAVLIVSFLLLTSCDGGRGTARGDTTHVDRALAEDSAVTDAKPLGVRPYDTLQCTPDTLRAGDILTVRMPVPHGPTFMIRAADGTEFIVVFFGEGRDRGQRKSLMPPDSFRNVRELRLDTRTFKAGPWVHGRDTNELVFRRAGGYRLFVGSDLETDGPVYAECVVRYRP